MMRYIFVIVYTIVITLLISFVIYSAGHPASNYYKPDATITYVDETGKYITQNVQIISYGHGYVEFWLQKTILKEERIVKVYSTNYTIQKIYR